MSTELMNTRANACRSTLASFARYHPWSACCTRRRRPANSTTARMAFAFNRRAMLITSASARPATQVSHPQGFLKVNQTTPCLTGKRCEFLTSVSFAQNGSYIEMPSLKTKPEANITMIFSTEEENGILVYNGESQHIAVELFRGRVRVSYDVGNYPVSNMFRYL